MGQDDRASVERGDLSIGTEVITPHKVLSDPSRIVPVEDVSIDVAAPCIAIHAHEDVCNSPQNAASVRVVQVPTVTMRRLHRLVGRRSPVGGMEKPPHRSEVLIESQESASTARAPSDVRLIDEVVRRRYASRFVDGASIDKITLRQRSIRRGAQISTAVCLNPRSVHLTSRNSESWMVHLEHRGVSGHRRRRSLHFLGGDFLACLPIITNGGVYGRRNKVTLH